jgi:Trk K+ transport system NAD-binding subunit
MVPPRVFYKSRFMSKFLIIGLDYFGINLACALDEAGHFVMGLDHKPPVDQILGQLGTILITESISQETLCRIGARDCDLVILVSSQESETNKALIISSLNTLGASFVVVTAKKNQRAQEFIPFVVDLVSSGNWK